VRSGLRAVVSDLLLWRAEPIPATTIAIQRKSAEHRSIVFALAVA